uniref:NADH-ubiquinone oxidoreductase chain 5 n=1 Tax=Mesenchytraeus cf. pedatus SL-2017 TaxID=2052678 RepID=A0A286KAX0_9ANNE|nr:NADH dehydrogenase subunit 5 [Mesenchytraeus cf. pedatus SL-2017]
MLMSLFMKSNPFHIANFASNMIFSLLLIVLMPTIYFLMVQETSIMEWTMASIMSTPITFTLIIDPLGLLFSCTVLFISGNVLMFSTIYMKDDLFINRFTILVLLFIMSMNLLIFIPHFMILLIGWDGLGITSFILVIYYQNPKSLAAGLLTALTNRIGDVMLLLSIAWTLNQGHWYIMNMWQTDMIYMQVIAITIAAMTKSAQMPFSSWLPAAMAAPTPVSALVHSSTLVTAGVFLLIRFYPFLHTVKFFNSILLLFAVSTMLMAGLSATTECDMKKIIALSTLSQLGMMMTSLGLNMPQLAYFHMLTHALFKALLFVCAGSFINSHLHSQDLRWMGNLTNQMPVASSCITLANLALCGFPFMAGFYSKDLIMESAINMQNNLFLVSLSLFSLGLTSFYSLRFSLVVMWSSYGGPLLVMMEEDMKIIKPMVALSTLSIFAGSAMSWIPPMSTSMFILPTFLKITPLILVTLGLLFAWWALTVKAESTNTCELMMNPISHRASCSMWYLVPMSSQFTMKMPMVLAHNYLKSIDQGWTEVSSGQGTNKFIMSSSNKYLSLSPKTPSSYILTSGTSSVALIGFIYLSLNYLCSLN